MDEVALGQDFLGVLWFYPVSIIPPMLHTHISFTYNQHYIIFATDSVIKTDTKKKAYIHSLWLINQTLNTEMVTLKYHLTMKHYSTDMVKNHLLHRDSSKMTSLLKMA